MPKQLTKETAPYLQQHADNPVDWYAWGEEAFRRAGEEDKPIHTPKDRERLVHRPRSPHNHAWPSGTLTSVFAMLRLHELTGQALYRDRVEDVFQMHGRAAAENPFSFSHLLAALNFSQRPLSIVLAGGWNEAVPLVETVHRTYHPVRAMAFAEDVPIGEGRHPVDGQPAAYVCRNRTCDAPVERKGAA